MENKNITFPKGFLWGSATSAPQTENMGPINIGGKSETIWENSFKNDPDRYFEQRFCEGDFYNRYKEDIKIAADLNFNSLRFSISWARLVPDGINVNLEAVEFYKNVFNECKKYNIKVFVVLNHFDHPMWVMEQGGWENKKTAQDFAKYSSIAFEKFGDLVERWVSFNEPVGIIEGQYWYDVHPPFENNFKKGISAMLNLNLAHALSLQEFRKSGLSTEFGLILNITLAVPRSKSESDVKASKIADLFQWKCFMDTAYWGKFPNELYDLLVERDLWPSSINIADYNKEFLKEKIDFLGVNYYSPLRVKSLDYEPVFDESRSQVTPETHFYQKYEMPGRRMNIYRGWEIYPKTIYSILMRIKEEYENINCFISENGMGVQNEERFRGENGMIQDKYRIEFMAEHLMWIAQAISEGSSCNGYHMWTYIDNWSWINAYKNRYGFIELDLTTPDNVRREKLSASWIRNVIKENKI